MERERHLVSLRRRVPAERAPRHRELWAELRREVTARGAHAWRFLSRSEPELSLEFLEFGAQADPRAAPEVRALLDRLEAEVGGAGVEEWREAGGAEQTT